MHWRLARDARDGINSNTPICQSLRFNKGRIATNRTSRDSALKCGAYCRFSTGGTRETRTVSAGHASKRWLQGRKPADSNERCVRWGRGGIGETRAEKPSWIMVIIQFSYRIGRLRVLKNILFFGSFFTSSAIMSESLVTFVSVVLGAISWRALNMLFFSVLALLNWWQNGIALSGPLRKLFRLLMFSGKLWLAGAQLLRSTALNVVSSSKKFTVHDGVSVYPGRVRFSVRIGLGPQIARTCSVREGPGSHTVGSFCVPWEDGSARSAKVRLAHSGSARSAKVRFQEFLCTLGRWQCSVREGPGSRTCSVREGPARAQWVISRSFCVPWEDGSAQSAKVWLAHSGSFHGVSVYPGKMAVSFHKNRHTQTKYLTTRYLTAKKTTKLDLTLKDWTLGA
ncbi:hypothetical protein B0H11DRAFT_2193884 [Mycena galericulata]|nr:hypothetical protein B0H11DRAFT_2193884 [Mycena galericulata]